MSAVSDLVTTALKEIGVVAEGETPSSEAAADGLAALNRMIDQWAVERLQIPIIARTTFPIISGTQTYSIAGTATVPSPNTLDHVNFTDSASSPTIEYELASLTDDGYAQVRIKTLTSPFPSSYYYSSTTPNGTLTLFPVPTLATLTGIIYAAQPVGTFTSLAQTLSLPPGYEELLITGLALRLAGQFTRQVDPMLRERYGEARAIVKRSNTRLQDLSFEAGALGSSASGGYSIYEG